MKGIAASGPHARGIKTIVFSLVARYGDASSFKVENVKASTLQRLLAENVLGEAHIMTTCRRSNCSLACAAP